MIRPPCTDKNEINFAFSLATLPVADKRLQTVYLQLNCPRLPVFLTRWAQIARAMRGKTGNWNPVYGRTNPCRSIGSLALQQARTKLAGVQRANLTICSGLEQP